MNTAFWKYLFLAAAAFNVGMAALFAIVPETGLARLFYLTGPGPAVVLIFRLFLLMVALMGAGYALAGMDIRHNRGFIQIGVLGKAVFVAVTVCSYTQGLVSPLAVAAGSGDIVWAILFAVFLARTGGLFSLETRIG